MKLTERLSNFVVQTHIGDFPEEVIETSKKCFLDWMGVAFGGMGDGSVKILIDLIKEIGGQKQASVFGYGIKTNILNAAFVNGMMSHVLDYDDAHRDSRSHPSVPMIPALLSVSEHKKLNGAELITAFVSGFEVSTRIGMALGKAYYESGWHATSVLGRFGAAAGVGKLLRLDGNQLVNAFGLAATQAGGLRRVFGTMGKPFHAGKAAMDGMLSAMLAQRGFTASDDILDGKSNFFEMFSPKYDARLLYQGLGKDFQVLKDSFKPHAACLLTHPAIDGLIRIRETNPIHPDSIEQIDLEVSPLCLAVTDKVDPKNGLEGKFSLYFCVALAMIHGEAKNSHFTDETVLNPQIRGLMRKIKAHSNKSLEETEANVTVKLKNGNQYSHHVIVPKGDPRNPLSFDEIVRKFMDLAQNILSEKKINQIISMIQRLETLEDISKLSKLCYADKTKGDF